MTGWVTREARYWRRRRVDPRPLLLIIVFALGLGFYVYKHWHVPSLGTISGNAYVVDGDSIEIWSTRIRLEGIDAPELAQSCNDAKGRSWPCGSAAARELKRHIGGNEVRCEATKFDRYGRMLAVCFRPDQSDINAWMVREGWALAYGRASSYRAEQSEAESAKRGLWAGTFTPPWDWRHQHPR